MDKTIKTKQWSLQGRDWIIGSLLAGVSAALASILTVLEAGSFDFDWKAIGITALTTFIAYIGKNLTEPGKTIVIKDGK